MTLHTLQIERLRQQCEVSGGLIRAGCMGELVAGFNGAEPVLEDFQALPDPLGCDVLSGAEQAKVVGVCHVVFGKKRRVNRICALLQVLVQTVKMSEAAIWAMRRKGAFLDLYAFLFAQAVTCGLKQFGCHLAGRKFDGDAVIQLRKIIAVGQLPAALHKCVVFIATKARRCWHGKHEEAGRGPAQFGNVHFKIPFENHWRVTKGAGNRGSGQAPVACEYTAGSGFATYASAHRGQARLHMVAPYTSLLRTLRAAAGVAARLFPGVCHG
ncbi:hypothetical protein PXK58_00805 [Phaeobacter gallaeciensis]|uniref:hypothetical protein n=1 Tax=Phaeobacter gallaeciensis TaxID=60890 RepID=UPI00237FDEB8|nr:hypothetical protein [Phaeobacter gallaeciensis]MDE4272975.1 hypothetical protein [Phaeobacter gallaeciensis]MDE4298072.1 hypothetical protein [Phaeobacter gallaeciensis]MDE5183260.1 hypothetical protein [Phaeobacter gallaeciensis]